MKFTNRIKNFLDAPIASEEFGLDSWKNYEVKFTQWMEAFSTKFNNNLSICQNANIDSIDEITNYLETDFNKGLNYDSPIMTEYVDNIDRITTLNNEKNIEKISKHMNLLLK